MAKADRTVKDKQRAAYMKDHKIERTTGICAVCYKQIPNDTFGGSGAQNHYPGPCMGTKKGS